MIPGRNPLIFFGPIVNNHHDCLVFLTRDGKGINLVDNVFPFEVIWTEEVSFLRHTERWIVFFIIFKINQNAHETVINALCASNDSLFTAGNDGIVKRWKNLDRKPTVVETIDVGKRINALCVGPIHTIHVGDPESEEGVETFNYTTIYAGDYDGVVRRLKFSA